VTAASIDAAGHLVVDPAQVTQAFTPAGEASTVTVDNVITETVPEGFVVPGTPGSTSQSGPPPGGPSLFEGVDLLKRRFRSADSFRLTEFN
jgi:hypothetical protein